jgi:hypothetical protein
MPSNNHAAAEAYRALATRLTKDSAKVEAAALRDLMKRSNPCLSAPEMVQAYLQTISHMKASDIRVEGVELRTLFRDTASHVYIDAYAALAAKLNDADASSESEVLLEMLDETHPLDAVPLLVAAYPVLAPRLPADQVSGIATRLRALLDRASNPSSIGILIAYGSVAAEVSSSEARAAATLMAER